MITVFAGLDRIIARCGHRVVADHERIWGSAGLVTDPQHLAAAAVLREQFCIRPAAGAHLQVEVEVADLSAYDAVSGTAEVAQWPPNAVQRRVKRQAHRTPIATAQGTAHRRALSAAGRTGPRSQLVTGGIPRCGAGRGIQRSRGIRCPPTYPLYGFPGNQDDHRFRLHRPPRCGPRSDRPPGSRRMAGRGPQYCVARPAWHRQNPPGDRVGDRRGPRRAPGRLRPGHRLDHPTGRSAPHRPELRKIARYGLIVIDEVGYIPFDTEAANLSFQLVSTRYEKSSIILTSNCRFPAGARSSARPPSPQR